MMIMMMVKMLKRMCRWRCWWWRWYQFQAQCLQSISTEGNLPQTGNSFVMSTMSFADDDDDDNDHHHGLIHSLTSFILYTLPNQRSNCPETTKLYTTAPRKEKVQTFSSSSSLIIDSQALHQREKKTLLASNSKSKFSWWKTKIQMVIIITKSSSLVTFLPNCICFNC